jgi:uncharacterized protein YggE
VRKFTSLVFTLLLAVTAWAQTSVRVVRAVGTSTLSAKPDQVKVDIGVVTTASTAQEAAAQNASRTDAVIAAIQKVLGSSGDIQTIAYSVTPNYKQPLPGSTEAPVLTGFTVTNIIEVTSSALGSIGSIIDAATQAGANSVQSLRFGIKDDEPLRAQALSSAAKEARAHAEAIAGGLGLRLGAVSYAQEGAQVIPVQTTAGAASATPVIPGLVQVSATVTADFELVQ